MTTSNHSPDITCFEAESTTKQTFCERTQTCLKHPNQFTFSASSEDGTLVLSTLHLTCDLLAKILSPYANNTKITMFRHQSFRISHAHRAPVSDPCISAYVTTAVFTQPPIDSRMSHRLQRCLKSANTNRARGHHSRYKTTRGDATSQVSKSICLDQFLLY